ncbi:XRE family transcriptional regulator [Phenylobacterium sp.]|uniref:XRE family transcriptional regulator n=1 Tax=Phenylobacterium sp. TaxID=1871053 RepID=UPI002730E881|nr:XRE family transcriptional regulator [Phenylobacterium sp.]MDP1874457.1 XRE family transcriptional regulator [Phenylobacterium sp.]
MTTRLSAAAGAAIRRLRRDRGWTLSDLSARSGVPLSSLSKVELGQTSLGYEVLIRLCRALGVEIDHLLGPNATPVAPHPAARRAVIRAGEGEACDLGGMSGLAGATELLRRSLTPVILEVVETTQTGGLLRAPGEAYLLVLAGQAVMHSDAYAPLPLHLGDGVYFDAEMGFTLTTGGETPAKVLLLHQGECVRED